MNAQQRRSLLKPYKREWLGQRVRVESRWSRANGISGTVKEVRYSKTPYLLVVLDVAILCNNYLVHEVIMKIDEVVKITTEGDADETH